MISFWFPVDFCSCSKYWCLFVIIRHNVFLCFSYADICVCYVCWFIRSLGAMSRIKQIKHSFRALHAENLKCYICFEEKAGFPAQSVLKIFSDMELCSTPWWCSSTFVGFCAHVLDSLLFVNNMTAKFCLWKTQRTAHCFYVKRMPQQFFHKK